MLPGFEVEKLLFVGQHIGVRRIKKKDGSFGYGLYRPTDDHQNIIDEYRDREYVERIAQFIEENGGDYSGPWRRKAREYASQHGKS